MWTLLNHAGANQYGSGAVEKSMGLLSRIAKTVLQLWRSAYSGLFYAWKMRVRLPCDPPRNPGEIVAIWRSGSLRSERSLKL